MISFRKYIFIFCCAVISLSITTSSAKWFSLGDLQNPANYAWPHYLMISCSHTVEPEPEQSSSWFDTIVTSLKVLSGLNILQQGFEVKQKEPKIFAPKSSQQLLDQAQTILNQTIAVAGAISDNSTVRKICSPFWRTVFRLFYGTDFGITSAQRLLQAAGYHSITNSLLAKEVFRQSRIVAAQSNPKALATLVWPKKFDLAPLIAQHEKLESTEIPYPLQTYGQ